MEDEQGIELVAPVELDISFLEGPDPLREAEAGHADAAAAEREGIAAAAEDGPTEDVVAAEEPGSAAAGFSCCRARG